MWRRRVKTIPAMLVATVLALLGSPLIVFGAVLYDLVSRRRRLPAARAFLFALQYAVNDSIEILLAGPLWLIAGFGTRLDSRASMRRHERLQVWSLNVMARRAEQLLGLRVELDPRSAAALTPGPVVVLCRHVSVFDASLPSLLYHQLGYHVREVIMAELLADPGFDLLYGRLGSVFIPRDNGPDARDQIAALGNTLDGDTAVVLFPEGRLYRPAILDRQRQRLAQKDPARTQRLDGLRHVLAPRPGGVSAFLDAAPDADVVVIAHAGLDEYPTLKQLARAAPLATPITVEVWRIPAGDVPRDDNARVVWLDELWCRLDDWVDARLAHEPSSATMARSHARG